jgi:flagellar biosynthesis protein FlhF
MIKKFYANTTREALRQVRDALGANAIILSNRQVEDGIEIMAVADMDVASLTANQQAPVFKHTAPAPDSAPIVAPEYFPHPQIPRVTEAPRRAAAQQPAKVAVADAPLDGVVQDIVQEIKFLRGMLEGQLAGFAWGDMERREPAKIEALKHMLSAGFSPLLARQLLDKMSAGYDYEKGLKWVKAALAHNLRVAAPGQDLVELGGVYALVGPTGVGKTTTVAKLAARATLKHGPSKIALVTTDSYRIGAHDQLRIYGRILGVPVYAIKDEADLQLTLTDLQDKHLVLIDTVGMSQRDRRLTEQVAMLCGEGRNVKRLLLIGATGQGSTLEDVVRAYKGTGMEGCILTKIDEAQSLGAALDVIIRHKLELHYVTNGQRVPEDLHLANALYLVDRALKSPEESAPFTLKESDYPVFMAGALNQGAGDAVGSSGKGAYGV